MRIRATECILRVMYLAIDIGGTKTLCALFDNNGSIMRTKKFATSQRYESFLGDLAKNLISLDFKGSRHCAIGAPGVIDRKHDLLSAMGNLDWTEISLRKDIESIVKIPTSIENDAKIAGFYEALQLNGDHKKVLYITISTGIGIGLTTNGKIDLAVSDAGGKGMFFEHKSMLQPWENYASGKAIYEEFGMKASDIVDPTTWKEISSRFVEGFIELITLTSPDIICVGGGVGAHFEKFEKELKNQLNAYESDFVHIPPIVKAKNAEEAVIYGCFEYAKQQS